MYCYTVIIFYYALVDQLLDISVCDVTRYTSGLGLSLADLFRVEIEIPDFPDIALCLHSALFVLLSIQLFYLPGIWLSRLRVSDLHLRVYSTIILVSPREPRRQSFLQLFVASSNLYIHVLVFGCALGSKQACNLQELGANAVPSTADVREIRNSPCTFKERQRRLWAEITMVALRLSN